MRSELTDRFSLLLSMTMNCTAILFSVVLTACGPRERAAQAAAPAPAQAPPPVVVPQARQSSLPDSVVSFAKEFLGKPYVSGGCSKDGFDCSGFVYFVFKHFNINVPRTSAEFQRFGTEVSVDQARKGDIIVFLSPTRNAIGHVGIVYEPKGMETDFIHASSSKEMQVMISSLKNPGYTRRFVKVVRVL